MPLIRGTWPNRKGLRATWGAGEKAAGADLLAERSLDVDALAGFLELVGGPCQFAGTPLATGATMPPGSWLLDDGDGPLFRRTTLSTAITFVATSGDQDLYAVPVLESGVTPDLAVSDLDGVEFVTVLMDDPAPSYGLKLGTGGVTASAFDDFTYASGAYAGIDAATLEGPTS
jgi:hypothetical protein